MKKNRSQLLEIAPLNKEQQVRLDNPPQHTSTTNHSTRKRVRATSLVGAAISTGYIICFSLPVSAHNAVNQNNVGRKIFIQSERIKKRDLSGAWNWNEDDLPLTAVTSKSYKEPSNRNGHSKIEKGKSDKNNHSSSEWSSSWSPRWSSPQKPMSGQPTPWNAAGHLPTTSRPSSVGATSKPTSKIPTATEAPMAAPTPQSPTYKPTNEDPTYSPTTASSTIPSTYPSSSPSTIPSTYPSSIPSMEPTSYPSSMPSFSPSSGPSPIPSTSPSSTPTSSTRPTPLYMPSTSPTISSQPTSSPSANPSSSPTSPRATTAAPTVSPKPTTSQRTGRPTWAPTISHEPSWAERTGRPTWAPTISHEPTNANRTMNPTLSPATASPTSNGTLPSASMTPSSSAPTSSLVTDSRSGLKMELFGLEFMDESQVDLFQSRTALYMDTFYNGTDSTSLLDLIKRQVTDMTVVINVVQQTPPDLLGDIRGRTLQAIRMNEKRVLQDAVTEPCIGDALTVTFDMELKYRTADPKLARSDEVISFPFRTIPFREDYINNYLKAGGKFGDLYCTSQMIFSGGEKTNAPTIAPTTPTSNGTLSPTIPSMSNGTISPTIPSTSNGTLSPTIPSISNGTLSPTIPSISNGTLSPTIPSISNGTLSPTILSTSNGTLSPTIPSISNGTLSPTTPSTSNGTLSPTIPSTSNGTLSPTIPSTSNGTLSPTMAAQPSIAPSESVPTSNMTSLSPTGSMPPASSFAPSTSTQEPPPQTGLRMNMFGLTEPLDSLGVLLYNERTANYIESFYNDYASTVGFRGQVLDVTATVEVTGQFGLDGEFTPVREIDMVRGSRHGHNEYDMAESDEDESYLPEHATVNSDYFINARYRFGGDNMGGKKQLKGTRMLQILDSCSGDRIDLEFTASLSYRLTNSSLTVRDIINEPFSTVKRRNDYMDDVLKGIDPGPFGDLTCTGKVQFPAGGSPTASPIPASIVPTLDVEKPSQQPSIFSTSNDTIVPTLDAEKPSQQPSVPGTSNVTTAVTLSSPPSVLSGGLITERRSNVGQDLFGIINLDPMSTDVYNIQTAAFISEFYVNRPVVSISTVSVSVTDTSIPIGPIAGSDCSEIDPLTVSFTIEMTYSTTSPINTFDEIITRPFSTAERREVFIRKYLKPNDVNGGFATLQCVSELSIPASTVTTTPTGAGTGTSAPSISPTEFIDDLLEVRSGRLPERSCLDKVDPKLLDSSEEIEISFLYGVESKTSDYFFLDELEQLILDFLQVSILMCLEDGEQASPQVWRIDDRKDTAGVIRVRYPDIGEASTMSKCDPTISHAKGCAVMNTKILVTSVGIPVNKVHRDVLMLLNDAFKEGAFVAIIPELILTAYVGPDPEEYQSQVQTKASTSSQEGGSKSSRVVGLLFSITVVVIAGLVAWFAFPLVRQELVKGAVRCCTRRRQPQCVEESALIVYQGDRETDDDVHGSPQ